MAFELAPEQHVAAGSVGSPDSSSSPSNDIDRLLSEILNDPNVFSLVDSPSSSSASSAASPPCYSPCPQQLEQEALASLGQQQLHGVPSERCYAEHAVSEIFSPEITQYPAPETPSPLTPSSATEDHQSFFPPCPLPATLPSRPHTHPTSLPLYHNTPLSRARQLTQQAPSFSPFFQDIEVVVSQNVNDTYLRGKRGKITSLQQGIASVYVYCYNQECQVPGTCIDLVRPDVGDWVRIIHGPLLGVMGVLFNSMGSVMHVQLCNGTYAQAATKNVAKLVVDGSTPTSICTTPNPLPSPTSPSLVSPSCESPLLSPASLQNGCDPSLSLPSPSYPLNPSDYTNGSYSPNSSHFQNSPYVQCTRQLRLPAYHPTITRSTMWVNSRAQLRELQRRRYQQKLHQQRCRSMHDFRQSVMQRIRTNGRSVVKQVSKRPELDSLSLTKYMDWPTQDMLEEVRGRKMLEYDFSSTGDGGELSSNCIQVSLICPLSQSRMVLPCRGAHCRHPQCFDAEAYIEYNKCVMSSKGKEKGVCHVQSMKQQLFKCPLCSKHLPFNQLYVDKTMLQILQETDQDEVEFNKTGSWKPVEKKSLDGNDVIDLTVDDEGNSSP